MTTANAPELAELQSFARRISTPKLRTMRAFAENEIILPTGPFAGQRFKAARQPFGVLWFDAIDSGLWRRHAMTGPIQSGKSLIGLIIPALYHIFEIAETIVVGVPDLQIAKDKWNNDFLPVIERTRFREELPRIGGGSRGGFGKAIQFRHGPVLRFMSGAGRDEARSHFNTRVVLITETDKMDESSSTSREGDKVSQIEGRTESFGNRAVVYMECTTSTSEGRTWREVKEGTDSTIVMPCVHCKNLVAMERENLSGWNDAETIGDAKQSATWTCPDCEKKITNAQRRKMNQRACLLHRGEEVHGDKIEGKPVATDTLGFRWSAFHNMFRDASDFAEKEWRGARDPDQDNADRVIKQQTWAVPHDIELSEGATLDAQILIARQGTTIRGVAPAGTLFVTVGMDVGKYLCHWCAVAWRQNATPCVIDYDRQEVASVELGTEVAIMNAMRTFRDHVCAHGWKMEDEDGTMKPNRVLIDSGYMGDIVKAFVRESDRQVYWPMIGYGAGQESGGSYRKPRQRGNIVTELHEGYHVVMQRNERVRLIEADADFWKSFGHERIHTPQGNPGAFSLFKTEAEFEHLSFAKHLTAERQVQEYEPERGIVTKWVRVSRNNHWLDAYYIACVGAHHAGARVIGANEQQRQNMDEVKKNGWFASQKKRKRK